MAVDRFAEALIAALETVRTALATLQSGLTAIDEASTVVENVLRGTGDAGARRVHHELREAHHAMETAHNAVAQVDLAFRRYVASITDGNEAPSGVGSGPARQVTPLAPAGQLSHERLAELRRELPPDVVPKAQRAPGTPQLRTHGRWIGPDGRVHAEISGQDGKDQRGGGFVKRATGRVPMKASDVEMNSGFTCWRTESARSIWSSTTFPVRDRSPAIPSCRGFPTAIP